MRSLCLLAFGCLVGLLLYTYDLKLKTRKLEVSARELVTALQDESDFLALMRAEVSYLSRPERIEEIARKQLRMEPVAPAQLVPWKAVVTGPDSGSQSQVPAAQSDGIAALIEKSGGSNPSYVAR
ncbi:MAG: cell division protein FtsL [Rhodomicrobium sp.]